MCRGVETLPQDLIECDLPCLQYLNIRKSKISEMHTLSKLFMERTLTTLILDGQKIANTDTLEKLLGERESERRERFCYPSYCNKYLSSLVDFWF